jgi:hypothetical protein
VRNAGSAPFVTNRALPDACVTGSKRGYLTTGDKAFEVVWVQRR